MVVASLAEVPAEEVEEAGRNTGFFLIVKYCFLVYNIGINIIFSNLCKNADKSNRIQKMKEMKYEKIRLEI